MNHTSIFTAVVIVLLSTSNATAQGQSVVNGPHNLSAGSADPVHATMEDQVCIFCHAPHRTRPIQPLWNRLTPFSAYNVYSSQSLDARPGQPTGTSKMCLSCHDGTIALGSVVSRDQVIQMASGITTIPPGGSNLGTDLSDDHPISFRFDSTLAALDRNLVPPSAISPTLRLDSNGELQCTTCHDAHDNSFGDFLVMDNTDSTLCRSCHQISTTTIAEHQDCMSCHRTHSAPSGPYLLTSSTINGTCLDCHDGTHTGAANILDAVSQFSVHVTNSPADTSDSLRPDRISRHTTCADCHEPHSMIGASAIASSISPGLGRVSGISTSGSQLHASSFEYEVCYKCHGDNNAATRSWVARRITQVNTRMEFESSAVSFHPVQGPGRNANVPSLRAGWSEASTMQCSDCHGSDTSRKAGGSGPNGIHGSNEPPLLIARYETADFTAESSSAYALCYRCHERDGGDGILSDRTFPHRIHVVDSNTSCATCHDAHGVSSAQGTRVANSHLINFDSSVVFADPGTRRLEFKDMGTFSGSCTLVCHGKVHSPLEYAR